jgi:hypothetical protein
MHFKIQVSILNFGSLNKSFNSSSSITPTRCLSKEPQKKKNIPQNAEIAFRKVHTCA